MRTTARSATQRWRSRARIGQDESYNVDSEKLAMSTAKEELFRLIEGQPDDSSREEIVRELAFHVMVQRGLADADAKRAISNEEMAQRIRRER